MRSIVFILFLAVFHHTLYGVSQESGTGRLKSIRSKIHYNNTVIKQKKQRAKNYVSHLGTLKRDLRVQKLKLRQQQNRFNYYQQKSRQTKRQLTHTKSEYDAAQALLGSRLVHLYKHQPLGSFSFLLGPKDYSHAISHSYYFDKVIKVDTAYVTSLDKTYQRYQSLNKTYIRQKSTIKKLTTSIESRKQSLHSQSNRVTKKITVLQREITAFEKRNKLLKADSIHIGNIIRKQPQPKQYRYYAKRYYNKPTKGWLSSRYGKRRHPIFRRTIFHRGIDIAAPAGRPIRSSNTGYVVFSGWQKGYGRITIIDHGFKNYKRYSSVYAHQSRTLVRKGQYIRQNQLIGYVGSSGYATGPHLHFELRVNGKPVDPLLYFNI